MSDSDLRQQMWDLIYGLLPDDATQALIQRIKSDPLAARLYAEARLQTDLVGRASRIVDHSLVFQPEAMPIEAVERRTIPEVHRRRSGNWLAGAAAAALAALLLIGFVVPWALAPGAARELVIIDVTSRGAMIAGLSTPITLHTHRHDTSDQQDDAVATDLTVRLLSPDGSERFSSAVRTSDAGEATFTLPGDALQPGSRLEVSDRLAPFGGSLAPPGAKGEAAEAHDAHYVSADLPIQPEPTLSYFLAAAPTTAGTPNQPVGSSRWDFGAFSALPSSPPSNTSAPVPNTFGIAGQISGKNEAKPAPVGTPPGGMLADSVSASALGAAAPRSATADARVRQMNAGGRAGLAVNEPATQRAVDELAANKKAETLREALAAEPAEKAVTRETAHARLVESGKPLPVTILPEMAGQSLDVEILCRGVTVASRNLPEASAGEVEVPLPVEADGHIEARIVNRAARGVVTQQEFIRQPAKRLKIDVSGLQNPLPAGGEAQLMVRVTNEAGEPVPSARLGVRVWNEEAIRAAEAKPLLLADAIKDIDPESPASRLEAVKLSLADGMNRDKQAVNHSDLDSFTASKPLSRNAPGPITLATNRNVVDAELASLAAGQEMKRKYVQHALGVTAIAGGIGTLVLVGLLVALRAATQMRAMAPSLLAAAASLVIGLYWTTHDTSRGNLGPLASLEERTAAPAAASAPAAPLITETDAENRLSLRRAESAAGLNDRGSSNQSVEATDPPLVPQSAGSPAAGFGGRAAGGALPAATPLAASPPPTADPSEAKDENQAAGRVLRKTLAVDEKSKEAESLLPAIAARAVSPAAAGPLAKSEGSKAGKQQAATPPPTTLYFDPDLRTDAAGEITLRFALPSATSEYRLLIDSLGDGRIGSREAQIIVAER